METTSSISAAGCAAANEKDGSNQHSVTPSRIPERSSMALTRHQESPARKALRVSAARSGSTTLARPAMSHRLPH